LIYRRPTADEAPAMAALHVQCWREAYAEILPAELMATFSAATRLPMWQAAIPNAERFVWAAFENDRPLGFIISGSTQERHIDDQDGHLWGIYIASNRYRKGIGRALVAFAAQDWITEVAAQ
jgi:ribosomal protein S18 acetylase RimI-like enzyme